MGRKLKTSVHVHEFLPVDKDDPKSGVYIARTEVFAAGEELPKWAQSHVGDHVYEDDSADEQESPEESPEPSSNKPARNAKSNA